MTGKITILQKEMAKIKLFPEEIVTIILHIFSKPNPPNFKSTPARIMEPTTGASTWALGSHRWAPHIGILTKKAETPQKNQIRFPETLGKVKSKEDWADLKINMRRGKDPANV